MIWTCDYCGGVSHINYQCLNCKKITDLGILIRRRVHDTIKRLSEQEINAQEAHIIIEQTLGG